MQIQLYLCIFVSLLPEYLSHLSSKTLVKCAKVRNVSARIDFNRGGGKTRAFLSVFCVLCRSPVPPYTLRLSTPPREGLGPGSGLGFGLRSGPGRRQPTQQMLLSSIYAKNCQTSCSYIDYMPQLLASIYGIHPS